MNVKDLKAPAKSGIQTLPFFAKNAEHMSNLTPMDPVHKKSRTEIPSLCNKLDMDAFPVKLTIDVPLTDKSKKVAEDIREKGGIVEISEKDKTIYQTVYGLQFEDDSFIPASVEVTKNLIKHGVKALVDDEGYLQVNILHFRTEVGDHPCLRIAKIGAGGINYEVEILTEHAEGA